MFYRTRWIIGTYSSCAGIMFGAVNIVVLFLLFRTIISQQFPNSEYAKYGRNPPTSNFVHLRRQEDTEAPSLLDLESGENVQKLVTKQDNQNFAKDNIASDDENNLGPDGPAYPGKSKKGTNEGNAAPQNVNRVQEITGQLWPMGVVPYFIDKESYDPTTVKRIVKAMVAIESVSCVMFRELEKHPKDSPDGWLHITNPRQERECVHVFSSIDGGTEVVLGFDCLHPEEILHSLLHALGFRDEVSHPHRGQYIRVLWNNIKPKYRSLYRIRHEDASYKLVEYDPMSVMHFHDRAFSDNGAATIAALVPGLQIAASTTLSQLDIMRLKLAFSHECNKRNIGDLLITCKKSLTPQKFNLGDSQEEPADVNNTGDNAVTVEQELDENDENQNPDNETPQEVLDGVKLAGKVHEDSQEDTAVREDERIPVKFRSFASYKNLG